MELTFISKVLKDNIMGVSKFLRLRSGVAEVN